MKYLLFLLLFLEACVPSFTPDKKDRIIVKKLVDGDTKIEWYRNSAAYANTPDFITIENKENRDTICSSDNIADLKISTPKKIILGFYGKPRLYMEPISIPSERQGYLIAVDTTFVFTDSLNSGEK